MNTLLFFDCFKPPLKTLLKRVYSIFNLSITHTSPMKSMSFIRFVLYLITLTIFPPSSFYGVFSDFGMNLPCIQFSVKCGSNIKNDNNYLI